MLNSTNSDNAKGDTDAIAGDVGAQVFFERTAAAVPLTMQVAK